MYLNKKIVSSEFVEQSLGAGYPVEESGSRTMPTSAGGLHKVSRYQTSGYDLPTQEDAYS